MRRYRLAMSGGPVVWILLAHFDDESFLENRLAASRASRRHFDEVVRNFGIQKRHAINNPVERSIRSDWIAQHARFDELLGFDQRGNGNDDYVLLLGLQTFLR